MVVKPGSQSQIAQPVPTQPSDPVPESQEMWQDAQSRRSMTMEMSPGTTVPGKVAQDTEPDPVPSVAPEESDVGDESASVAPVGRQGRDPNYFKLLV